MGNEFTARPTYTSLAHRNQSADEVPIRSLDFVIALRVFAAERSPIPKSLLHGNKSPVGTAARAFLRTFADETRSSSLLGTSWAKRCNQWSHVFDFQFSRYACMPDACYAWTDGWIQSSVRAKTPGVFPLLKDTNHASKQAGRKKMVRK